MFRASTCPSSGGQIVLSRHLVSSMSVNGCTACRMRADCRAEWRYQMLWYYNLSSWRWACWWSKHVEDCNVTYILLINKKKCIKVGKWNKFKVRSFDAFPGCQEFFNFLHTTRMWIQDGGIFNLLSEKMLNYTLNVDLLLILTCKQICNKFC